MENESTISIRLTSLYKTYQDVKGEKVNNTILASKTGIAQATLHKITTGQTKSPSAENLHSICQFFNISMDYFFDDNWRKQLESGKIFKEQNKNQETVDVERLVFCAGQVEAVLNHRKIDHLSFKQKVDLVGILYAETSDLEIDEHDTSLIIGGTLRASRAI